MRTAYTLADIEKIGEQCDYEHQANEFLRLTSSTLQVRYLRTGLYFGETDEKQRRDIYEFRLQRGTREYIYTFGDSLQNTWERFARHVPKDLERNNIENTFRANFSPDNTTRAYMRAWYKENEKLSTWEYASVKPRDYSILACMQTYDVGTFDDFIAEFCYEIDSKESCENAQRTYEAVVEQYHKLQALYSDKELQALASIA